MAYIYGNHEFDEAFIGNCSQMLENEQSSSCTHNIKVNNGPVSGLDQTDCPQLPDRLLLSSHVRNSENPFVFMGITITPSKRCKELVCIADYKFSFDEFDEAKWKSFYQDLHGN